MFSLNVSCAVCKELFKNTDAIYSTSCGHIFHYICLNQWKCKTTSCPVCRSYNPTSQSIFLNFEDGFEYEKVVEDLNTKLKNFQDKIKEIEEDNDVCKQWKVEREDKIKKLTEQNHLQNEKHSEELALKLKEIQTLQAHIETLGRENEVVKLTENIKDLSAENSKLKSDLNESESLRITLNQKIEMMEQRYENVTQDNENQLNENEVVKLAENIKELSVENSKLKSDLSENESLRIILNHKIEMLEQRHKNITSELENQLNESFKKENKPEFKEKQKTRNIHSRRNSNVSQKMGNLKLLSIEQQLNSNDKTTKKMASNLNLNQLKECKLSYPKDCRVIIKNFPKENIVLPLKDVVILLASKMSITVAEEDVLNVNFLNNRHIISSSNNIQLLVEFQNIEAKTLFFTHRNRLKFDGSTRFIKIKEYIDEKIYKIFMYANINLRRNAYYEYINIKDNKIIAKKKLNDTEEIVIQNEDHVDLLLSHAKYLNNTHHLSGDL